MWFVKVWDELDFWMMSAIIAVPAVFALGLVFIPARRTEFARWWTLLGTLAAFVLISMLFVDFLRLTDKELSNPDRQAQLLPARSATLLANWEAKLPMSSRDLLGRKPWIGRFHIDYFIGVDGINMALLLLASSLFVLAFVAGWKQDRGVRGFCLLYLLLETCVLGLLLSLDFFLFFSFLVAVLPLIFLLLAHWGTGRRPDAALKYFLFHLLGAVLILVAMLALYYVDLRPYYQELDYHASRVRYDPQTPETFRLNAFLGLAGNKYDGQTVTEPVNTFDLVMLARVAQASAALESRIALLEERLLDRSEDQDLRRQLSQAEVNKIHWQAMSPAFQLFCFLFLFLGFACFLPVVPLHTWFADAHEQAATPISMVLSGVLLSMGGYGILRIALPICPIAAKQLAWIVSLVGVVSLVYAALVALAQTDLKRLIAYCSISQMGFVLLGMFAWTTPDVAQYWSWGMKGAVFHLIATGLTTAGLFFVVGLLHERFGHTDLTRLGGVGGSMPVLTGLAIPLCFAALGLPLLSGFVGQFAALLGCWNFQPPAWPEAGQVLTMIAAGSLLITAGYILWAVQRVFLGSRTLAASVDDLDGREGFILGALVVLTVALGVWPMLVFEWLEPTVTGLVQTLAQATAH